MTLRCGLMVCVLGLSGPIGCASCREPLIDVTSATLRETTPQAAGFDIVIDLHNPNDEPLQLLEVEYEVRLDGGPAFHGRRAARSTLRPKGVQVIVLPAVAMFSEADATQFGETASVRGRLRYMTPGKIAELLFDAGLQRPKAVFEGEVPLSESAAPS